jgi:hypothetical protein
MTRNNSAINLPSARMQPMQEIRSVLQPKERERISHSPGINVTQIQRDRPGELHPKESIYITSPGHPSLAYEKLKIITNVVSGPNNATKTRNDRSYDHSANLSAFESAQGSVIQRQERIL